jgi:hypothetical protein
LDPILNNHQKKISSRLILNPWFIVVPLLILYLLIANDGRHHWHEFRHLYSGTYYSATELLAGEFDPGPAPVQPKEKVAAWYASEIFHTYLLRQLTKIFGKGTFGYRAIKVFYAILLITAVCLFSLALYYLGLSFNLALLTGLMILFSPVIIYLGFKLMGEVPALFFASIALAIFSKDLGLLNTPQIARYIFAGVAFALSTLASAKMAFFFPAFWLSVLTMWSQPDARESVARAGVITLLVYLVGWLMGFKLLGGSIDIYYRALAGFMSFTKPHNMLLFAAFNLALFGSGMWICAPFSWFSREVRLRRFYFVWLLLAAFPALTIAIGFLEPRYLVPALIPFVGIAALGAAYVLEWIQSFQKKIFAKYLITGLFGVVLIGFAAAAQFFIPFETDENKLVQALRSEIYSTDPPAILLPWNYSDFHFLHFLFPEKPLYLVQSPADAQGRLIEDSDWVERKKEMYGKHYIPDRKSLSTLTQRRKLYIGWTILPSIDNLRRLLIKIKLQKIAKPLDPSRFMNHMSQSWLWKDPNFNLQKIDKFGQYTVYEVIEKR